MQYRWGFPLYLRVPRVVGAAAPRRGARSGGRMRAAGVAMAIGPNREAVGIPPADCLLLVGQPRVSGLKKKKKI